MNDELSLSVYLPDLLLERLASGRPPMADASEEVLAATFFADLAGFTAMADRLAERGSQGPEQLTEVLDHVFGTLIDRVLQHGGDVVRFAGDAILVIWRASDPDALPEAVLRAARCALESLATPLEHPYLPGASLRLRVGIDAGSLTMIRVGGLLDRWEFVVTGQALRGMGLAAERAEAGQALVASGAWELLGGWGVGREAGAGCHVLERLRAAPPGPLGGPARRVRYPTVGDIEARPFIPGAVRHRIAAGVGGWLAELRPLSVLFVNLPVREGQRLPDRAQLQQLVHQTQRELYRYEGAVDKVLMDEKGCTLLAAFGLPPLSHEDDAERALRSAMAIGAHLATRGVPFRIGVASGRVYAGTYGHPERREYSILGDTVNLAARLMQHAQDEVLCDEATRRAVGRRLELEALPAVSVKGKREPVVPYRPVRALDPSTEVGGRTPGTGRDAQPQRPFFGREPERARLDLALDALMDRGQGGLVLLRGEPGIGKSAMIGWLLRRAQTIGLRTCYGCGDAIERSASYRAWRPVLAELVGLGPSSDLEQLRAAAQAAVEEHPQGTHWLPLLNALLPLGLVDNELTSVMSGSVRGENTRELAVWLLRGCLSSDPLLIVLEDAHWMDPASWALVASVRRLLPGVLVVLSARPMAEEPPAELEELLVPRPEVAVLDLRPLDPEDVCDVAAAAIGVDRLPDRMERLLHERAEGNPFYAEELARTLRDLGAILIEDGRCRLRSEGEDLSTLRLPDTVQGAVTSRLDRLDPQHQLTIKVASVVGRHFPYRVTHDVHPVAAARQLVSRHLETSVRGGLLGVEELQPELVYRFQHSITQQVAYNLLAHSQRRQIHGAVARWYEQVGSEDPDALLPRLAHHWLQAGDDAKTLHYCTLAGEQALDRGAPADAIYFLRCAVALLDRDPARRGPVEERTRRARLRRRLGEAYAAINEPRLALEQLLGAARELSHPFPSSRPGRALRAGRDLLRLALLQIGPRWLRPRLAAARLASLEEVTRVEARVADELFAVGDLGGMAVASLAAIARAERTSVYGPAAHAYNAIGYVLGASGLRALGSRLLERARAGGALAICNAHYARGLWLLGDARLAEAEEEIRGGIRHARLVGDIQAIATGLSCLGTRFELAGDFRGAMAVWRELLHTASKVGNSRHEFWASIAIGGALSMEGRLVEAQDWIRRREDLLAQEDSMTAAGFHGQRAQTFLRAGAFAQAREAAELTAQYVRETGPGTFTHIKGLTGLCETALVLWEHAEVRGAPDPSLPPLARRACRYFAKYARRFPVGSSRAHRFAGTAAWLDGRPGRARRLWVRAATVAASLGLGYDEALACIEHARHLPVADPQRDLLLARARQLAEDLGGELANLVGRLEAGATSGGSPGEPPRA